MRAVGARIIDAMLEGRLCCKCGREYGKPHSWRVLCKECWTATPEAEREGLKLATEKERVYGK